MIYRVAKKLLKKKSIRETSLNDRNKIAMKVLWYSIPALLLLIIMVIPTFYFNHLIKQDDYCQKIIQVNKITTTDDQFLQERCNQFDLDELLERAHQP